ncbi:hypothetical protein ZWY2020_027896 [Hordeum vulgare]|nr:hypothetical protein ZWY2020_027896 [Hordeum vulgare]
MPVCGGGVLTAWNYQSDLLLRQPHQDARPVRAPGESCPDCCVHFWLESCAICQEYRELHNQGFVMDIRWEANLELQKQQGRVRLHRAARHAAHDIRDTFIIGRISISEFVHAV